MRPARRPSESVRYPVVYASDGNWSFDMFKGISYLLGLSESLAPPFILVGIGYPGDSPHAGMLLRARDFTVPPYPPFDLKGITLAQEGVLVAEDGAKDFHGGGRLRSLHR